MDNGEPKTRVQIETYGDLVRYVGWRYGFTGLTDDEVDVTLWECTSFPAGSRSEVERQLNAFFNEAAKQAARYATGQEPQADTD